MTRYSSLIATDAMSAPRALGAAFRPGHPARNAAGIQGLVMRDAELGSVRRPELPVN